MTNLNLMSLIDRPTSGSITFENKNINYYEYLLLSETLNLNIYYLKQIDYDVATVSNFKLINQNFNKATGGK